MRWALLLCACGCALGPSREAWADCTPASHLSTCIDADTFFPHADSGRFFFFPGAATTPAGQMGFGLATTYLRRPIVLVLPTASTEPGELAAVDDLVDTTFLWSLGLSDRAELDVAVPITAYRSGSGASALRSEHATALPRTSLRDLRIGAAYALVSPEGAEEGLGITSRFELALPTGDEDSFAGDRSVVGLPGFAADVRMGPFVAGSQIGARLREPVDLAGSRIGSQLVLGLGAGAHLLSDDRLSVALEAIALPTFAAQATSVSSERRGDIASGRPLVPAEWALSLQSTPWPSSHFSIGAAAGGPLPFTGEAALTSPGFRASLVLRYAPSTEIRTPAP